MTPATAVLAARAEERALREPAFATVLAAVVAAPTGAAGTLVRAAARSLNRERLEGSLAQFRAASLTTAQVQVRLGLGTPQAVHRLRSRGKLVGRQLGNATWFPAWQFAGDGLRAELPRIIGLVTAFTTDAVAADRILRLVRDDLDGLSIIEALDQPGKAAMAWSALAELGA